MENQCKSKSDSEEKASKLSKELQTLLSEAQELENKLKAQYNTQISEMESSFSAKLEHLEKENTELHSSLEGKKKELLLKNSELERVLEKEEENKNINKERPYKEFTDSLLLKYKITLPTADDTSSLQANNQLTLTKLNSAHNKYLKLKQHNITLTSQFHSLNDAYNQQAPQLAQHKDRYDQLLLSYKVLANRLTSVLKEKELNCEQIIQLKETCAVEKKERTKLQKELASISNQVRVLLQENIKLTKPDAPGMQKGFFAKERQMQDDEESNSEQKMEQDGDVNMQEYHNLDELCRNNSRLVAEIQFLKEQFQEK